MNYFMDDNFVNKRVFSRLKNNVEDRELQRAIQELEYFNEVRKTISGRFDTNPIQLDFIKKFDNARQRIQI